MKPGPSFLLGVFTGAALLHAATTYHIVRATDGLYVIPKRPPRLAQCYVDIRAFTLNDWANHAQLASAIVQANRQQLLSNAATEVLQDTAEKVLPDWPKQ